MNHTIRYYYIHLLIHMDFDPKFAYLAWYLLGPVSCEIWVQNIILRVKC
jgi:hypothetical protein